MKTLILRSTAFVFLALVIGCGGSPGSGSSSTPAVSQPQSAESEIEAAIRSHLAQRGNLNLQAFDTKIGEVNVQGDHAQAKVVFQIKNGPATMELTYQLQKQAGAWQVINSDASGSGSSHPSLDPAAPGPDGGAPPAAGGGNSLADTLRSFKAAPSQPVPALPPGHPPTGSGSNPSSY